MKAGKNMNEENLKNEVRSLIATGLKQNVIAQHAGIKPSNFCAWLKHDKQISQWRLDQLNTYLHQFDSLLK